MCRCLVAVFVISFIFSIFPNPGFTQDEAGWTKVFECEFDSLDDLKKWNVTSNWDNANNEQQAYIPEACTVRDGCLVITAEKKDVDYHGKQRHYTSGKIETLKKFDVMYGRFDCRFKVPKGKGYWPAFWLLPSSGDWPPEIDWMEILGDKPNILYTTNHWGVHRKGKHPSYGKSYKASPDFSQAFHELSGYWDKNKITCFVDGKKVFESRRGVPHETMFVIVNLAVGGDWPGNPDKTTEFPGEMLVDYVRVFQKTE